MTTLSVQPLQHPHDRRAYTPSKSPLIRALLAGAGPSAGAQSG